MQHVNKMAVFTVGDVGYPYVAALAISCDAWCGNDHCLSIICGLILKICLWVPCGTIMSQWARLSWRLCPRRSVFTPRSGRLRAHWSPPLKFQVPLLLQFVLDARHFRLSGGAAAWRHVIASAQVLVPLCSDLNYLVKGFHWGHLRSADSHGIHGCDIGRQVVMAEVPHLRADTSSQSLIVITMVKATRRMLNLKWQNNNRVDRRIDELKPVTLRSSDFYSFMFLKSISRWIRIRLYSKREIRPLIDYS